MDERTIGSERWEALGEATMLLDLAISRYRGSVLLGCETKGLVRGCPEAAEQEPHLGAPLASLLKAAL